ncbi:MAG: SGNH/GDSL hydrolase family protein [Acutalibacteraceae bacterium]|nr:SGNH/GDSL hydrolase family protein [Acutalibacteraceae bacterium]
MKNVLLIGDSIRMGYDKAVKLTLDGIANVHFPKENCKFAAYVLRFLHEWKPNLPDGERVDVVHFNVGLWDNLRLFGEEPHTPIDIYSYYMERICIRIKKLFPDAKVIFATSTSVLSEKMNNDFKRYNEDVEQYNAVACEIAKKYGFTVNDLYALSLTLPEDAHSDAVHYYTTTGTEAFANQVLSYLAEALELESVPEYKEALYTEKPIGI